MRTRRFDDGSTIPTAVPGPLGRVIVVGAGISGLTAANALAAAGVDCVVVEARDRVGGRLDTVDVDGHVADLGGSWIHHPGANVLADWVDFAGTPWIVDPTGTDFTGYDLGERRPLTPAELAGVGYRALDPVAAIVAADAAAGRPDRSAAAVVDEALAGSGLTGAERGRRHQLLAAMIEQDAAAALDDVSARWAFSEHVLVGDVVDHVPVGGYRRVLAPLAAGLDLRLGRPVRRIAQTPEGVLVEGEGWQERGSHAIVTVPLGVLQSGAVEFVPPLPVERRAVIERTGFSNMEKVVLAFRTPFWRARGLQHSIVYPADRREAATWTWDFGLSPTIMILVAHSAVPSMRRDPAAWALEQLEALYGEPLPEAPTGVAVTRWLEDEYARGSYTHLRPGQDDADLVAMAMPVGRICFAGEHTSAERVGYADGGMSSGLREASRLLQRPVELRAG